MNSNFLHEENKMLRPEKVETDWQMLFRKVWVSRRFLLIACGIGTVIGIIIAISIPKEYTATILIAPENARRSSSLGIGALVGMADANINPSTVERDAIYPSIYPIVVNSTPFLIRLFDVKVHEQKNTAAMPLAQYIKERQKAPWWRAITSAPFRLMNRFLSLFKSIPKEEDKKKSTKIDIFRLTSEERSIASGIASRIAVGIDQKKRVITVSVTMQNPLVAATVADTVQACLQEYVTEYRTSKARRILKYTEELRNEAQTKYLETQTRYTNYADANQNLALQTSRAELIRLQNEMNLAHSTYNQMEQQVLVAKAKLEKMTPINAIIQPVQVPLNPSKPNKLLILVGCIFLFGAGGVTWILFMEDFIRNIKKRIADARMNDND